MYQMYLSEMVFDERSHDERRHDERGHDARGHDERGHDERGHDERGHDARSHDERGHDERGHDACEHLCKCRPLPLSLLAVSPISLHGPEAPSVLIIVECVQYELSCRCSFACWFGSKCRK
jgi:hypothetical protein